MSENSEKELLVKSVSVEVESNDEYNQFITVTIQMKKGDLQSPRTPGTLRASASQTL